jgi:hypothetical protein
MAFEEFLDKVGEKRRMEGITSRKFHLVLNRRFAKLSKIQKIMKMLFVIAQKKKELLYQEMIAMYLILKN